MSTMTTITAAQYDDLCALVDAAKIDGDQDTDVYASSILAVLDLVVDDSE